MEKYDDDFKRNAIKLVLEEKMRSMEVAKDLGIGISTLQKWLSCHRKNTLFKSQGEIQEQEELKCLRKENRTLKMERDILKKAMGIFYSTSKENTV